MKLDINAAKSRPVVNEEELMRQLAMNLKWLRSVFNLPQRVLSEYLNCDRSTYCYYETEKSRPTVVTLKRIADFYKVTVDDMLSKDLRKSIF